VEAGVRFCEEHWSALRQAVEDAGLAALVAESGERAAANMAAQLEPGGDTIDTFDPLMHAHMNIWAAAMHMAEERYGASPMAMMFEDPEHPEWQCPICYLNWCHAEHDRLCEKPGCDYPRGFTYDDYCISNSVAAAKAHWEELRP
jgi:hypothetical protein